MVSYKVYKPATQANDVIINAPKEIDKPEYPDKGINYAGFSKTLLSGNNYQLNPQIPADININYSFVGAELAFDLNRVNQESKDFYCTKVHLTYKNNGSAVAINDDIRIRAGSNGYIFLVFAENPAAYWELDIKFTIPIFIPKGSGLRFSFTRARAANEFLCANFYGWEE